VTGPRTRLTFTAELDQLRLQVEVMALRVGDALTRMQEVLASGDGDLAARALAADDEVDAMYVSLTERCYDLIRREQPVASDLRFVLSVLRLLEELERIADLSLRVVKQVPNQPLLASHPRIHSILQQMAAMAAALHGVAISAWTAEDLSLAQTLTDRNRAVDGCYTDLVERIHELTGPDAAQVAVSAVLVGRALERIADHGVIVGERLCYLLTGDPAYLASEVRR
jgi:phosphate transport system protein